MGLLKPKRSLSLISAATYHWTCWPRDLDICVLGWTAWTSPSTTVRERGLEGGKEGEFGMGSCPSDEALWVRVGWNQASTLGWPPKCQLGCLAPVLCQHPMPLGIFWRGFWEARQLPIWHRELHCSSGSGGILGWAGESELDSMGLEVPAAPALNLNLSNEVHGWSFLDWMGYIEEKTWVARGGVWRPQYCGQEAGPSTSHASSWPSHLLLPGPQGL